MECTGPVDDTVGVEGADNVTVNVRDGATIAPGFTFPPIAGIELNDGATILVEQGGSVDSTTTLTTSAISINSGADLQIDGLVVGPHGVTHVTSFSGPFASDGFMNSTVDVGETGVVRSTTAAGPAIDGRRGGNTYQIDGLVETLASGGHGIRVGNGDVVTIGSTGIVRTTDDDAGASHGIESIAATDVSVTVDEGGLIETAGSLSAGINIGADATVILNGSIMTAQDVPDSAGDSGAVGIGVRSGSMVTVGTTGTIVTGVSGEARGQSAHGIQTAVLPTEGGSTIEMNGSISTFGGFARGINGRLSDSVTLGGSSSISTEGLLAHGIFLWDQTTSPLDPGQVTIGGNVETTGSAASAIFLWADNADQDFSLSVLDGGRLFSQQAPAFDEISDSPGFPVVSTTLDLAGEIARPLASDLAIRFRGGDDTLVLHPTYSLTGTVDAGAGTDLFRLTGEAATSALFDFGANVLSGFESYQKDGAGTWTLRGDGSAQAGDFALDGGTLIFDGADLANVDFTTLAGTRLAGEGTLGATTVGGTVAPGLSIGTLSTGSLVFDAGSTYEVEVAASGAGDLLDVTGTATINGGTVNVLALDPNTAYSDGQQWVIIDTTGGVSGSGGVGGTGFDALSDNSAFLDFSLSYDDPGTPMQVLLTLATVADFASTAETYNQMQAASGLQQLDQTPGSDALAVFNALSMLSAEESRAAYDAASGELHASAQHALLDISDLFLSTIARRQGLLAASGGGGSNVSPFAPLAYAGAPHEALALAGGDPAERLAAWLAPMGEAGEIDGDGNAAALDQHAVGVAAGIDWMDRWLDGRFVAGLAAGYTNAEANVAARLSSAEFDSGHAGAYAAWDNERLRLSGAAAYAFHAIDTRRRILFPGVDRTATGDFDGHTLGLHGEGAYRLPAGGLSIAPLATADALFGWRGSGTENGAGALDLAVDAEDIQRVTTGLGVALGHAWAAGPAHLVAELRLLWEHAFGDDTPTQDVTLAGAPGAPFNVHGPARAKDWLGLGAGLGIAISDTASLTARYDGALSPEGGVHQGHLSLGYRF